MSRNHSNSSQTNLLFYMENCKTCNFFINTAHKSNILKNFKMICIDGQVNKFKSQGLKKVPTIIIPSINKQFDGNDCLKWLEEMIKLSSKNNNFGIQNEDLYIPDIGVVSNNSNNSNKSNNSMNQEISQLSSQISQLSTQMNNSQTNNNQNNQFEVPKTNIVKRNALNPIQPPITHSNSGNTHNRIVAQNTNQKNINNSSNQNNLSQPTVKPINQLFGYLQNEMSGYSDGYAYVNIDNPLPKSFLPPDKDLEIYTAPEGDKINKKKQDQLIKLAEMERTNEHEQYKNSIDEINRRIAMGEHNLLPKWVGANKDL